MKKLLNLLLFTTFILTMIAPLTGVHIHKLASTAFLLFSFIHTIVYWKKQNFKRMSMLAMIVLGFVSGVFGMIYDHIPLIAALHIVISIACVFFLAIHIFVFQRGLKFTMPRIVLFR